MADPKKRWQRLADAAGEDAVESAAAVSAADAERDLVAAGFDVKAERVRAEALIAELLGGDAASSKSAPEPATEPTAWVQGAASAAKRAPAPRRVLWLAAALLAAAATGGILYAAAHRPLPPEKPVDVPSATASAPPQPVAPSQTLTPAKPTGSPVDSKTLPR